MDNFTYVEQKGKNSDAIALKPSDAECSEVYPRGELGLRLRFSASPYCFVDSFSVSEALVAGLALVVANKVMAIKKAWCPPRFG